MQVTEDQYKEKKGKCEYSKTFQFAEEDVLYISLGKETDGWLVGLYDGMFEVCKTM